MTVFMIAFTAYLLYVSYCKIVFLEFRGKQHNRFFATLMSTVIPVFGSIPAFIMASKYERRVSGPATKMNDEILRFSIIGLQLLSVFVLFLPLVKFDGVYVDGINLIFGLRSGGESILDPKKYLLILIAAPFISAAINCVDIKFNVRNVVAYSFSLICTLVVFFIILFVQPNTSDDVSIQFGMWLYSGINITVMLLSIFSLIKVRNEFLLELEGNEKDELILNHKMNAKKTDAQETPAGTYKCAKCGNIVEKGTICSCRQNAANTLNSLMVEQNKKETSNFCVYCRRSLADGEVCNCVGEGFGITVKPEQFDGRKCRYCGQILIGDSLCVCEKIMKKSQPVSSDGEDAVEKSYFSKPSDLNSTKVSDELAELENKINLKFSNIKSTFVKKGQLSSNVSLSDEKTLDLSKETKSDLIDNKFDRLTDEKTIKLSDE